MDNVTKNYFSVSELAHLCNISRQTVLYYDKHDILKPNFIDDNGYRYYHFKEYLMLELILNFRKLGMPIDEIKSYIDNKSTANLAALLKTKISEYEKTIAHMKTLITDMNTLHTQLSQIPYQYIDTFQLDFRKKEFLILSPLINKKAPIKERIKMLGNLNLKIYKSGHLKYSPVSWIIKEQDFFNTDCKQKRYYCLPAIDNIDNENIICLPNGLYFTYTFQGSFQPQADKIKSKIINYLKANNLKLISPIKISAIKNFWTTNDKNSYISTISAAIERL